MSSTSVRRGNPSPSRRTIGGKTLSIETGRLAKQASGAVVVRIGDTMTLVATVAAPGREGLDFFPLTVDYREKVYAAGKFPGGFIKREGRPTTKEILTSRLIDRPIRPLFPESLPRRGPDPGRADLGRPPERSRHPLDDRRLGHRCSLAKVPFLGPIGGDPAGRVDGQLVAVADGRRSWPRATSTWSSPAPRRPIVMIEGFGQELPEPEMLDAIMTAHRLNQEIIALQHELLAALRPAPVRGTR